MDGKWRVGRAIQEPSDEPSVVIRVRSQAASSSWAAWGELVHPLADRGLADVRRVERAAAPFEQLFVALVGGVGDGVEEVHVAKGAAHILGRAGTLAVEEARIACLGLRPGDGLDPDRVVPVVAEVVDVGELPRPGTQEVGQRGRLGRVHRPLRIAPARVGDAPGRVAAAELPQVVVLPAHGGLDHEVQPVEPDVDRDLDAAEDPRLDLVELDAQAGDVGQARFLPLLVPPRRACELTAGGIQIKAVAQKVGIGAGAEGHAG